MSKHPVDVHIGNRLRILRIEAGKSQRDLAIVAGVVYQQIQKYERGANRLGPPQLTVFAKYLNCRIADFFAGLNGGTGPAGELAEMITLAREIDSIGNPAVIEALYFLVRSYNNE